jgi:hypothetical protein
MRHILSVVNFKPFKGKPVSRVKEGKFEEDVNARRLNISPHNKERS